MRRTTLTLPLLALASAALAQPPALPQPVPAAEAPITKYEPLTLFPMPTQQAVRGVATGANWLVRMNQAQGRFLHGYRPAVRQVIEGDDALRQAYGALALARAAKFTGDDRSAAVAGQAVLALLSSTRPDPTDPTCRVPAITGSDPLGFAAVLALAVYELPTPDERLVAEAERLCVFLRKSIRPESTPPEAAGLALQAFMTSSRVRPDAWKPDAVAKALPAYRAALAKADRPARVAALIPAFAELHLQTRHADAAAAVYEFNDALCGLQYPAAYPRNPTWAGAFRVVENGAPADAEPAFDTAACLESVSWAYLVTARNADVARAERYRQAAQDAAVYVTSLQYTEPNTRHFENTFRANVLIGGFHLSPSDGDLRVDAAGRCVSGLLRYLASGAER